MLPLTHSCAHTLHDIFRTDLDNNYNEWDKFAPQYDEENWYKELQDASGLASSPDSGLVSSPGPATEESASFAVVIQRAAEVLDL